MPKRLRKWNDLAHAAAWMQEQTGEDWEALDLANAGNLGGLSLHIHFRLPPAEHGMAWPPETPRPFIEGCMAQIVFNQDLDRLTQTDEFGIHLLRHGKGDAASFLKFDPCALAKIEDLRVTEADMVQFLDSVKRRESPIPAQVPDDASNGIDRNQVMATFHVKADADANTKFWDGRLGRPSGQLKGARLCAGKPGTSALWNPLGIAHYLLGGGRAKCYMTLGQLNQVMNKRFPELVDSWKEQTTKDNR
jgi:hypothetical protein